MCFVTKIGTHVFPTYIITTKLNKERVIENILQVFEY